MTIEEIKKLTAINNHTEARIEVAKMYGLKDFERVFKAIKEIQEIERSIPHEVSLYRRKKTNEMIEEIKQRKGVEESIKVYQVL